MTTKWTAPDASLEPRRRTKSTATNAAGEPVIRKPLPTTICGRPYDDYDAVVADADSESDG